jgi:hypothetical protein
MFDPSGRRNIHLVILALILIFAAALRVYHLGTNCLWEDEYFSLECSSGWGRTDMHLSGSQNVPDLISLRNARPVASIWSSIARDENHPPLYFILLRFWREMFGDSPAALRSLSVVGSLIGIVLLYFVGEVALGPGVALWACAIMAVAWPQIQQSQQARAYTLITATALACLLALLRIQKFGVTRFRIAWLFTAALALPLLHYMAATSLLAMIVFAAISLRGSTRIDVLICFAAVAGAYAILWGPELFGQHKLIVAGTSWMVPDGPQSFLHTMGQVAGVYVRFLVEPRSREMMEAVGGIAVLVVPPLLLRRFPQLLLWWLWLVVPVAFALVIDLCFQRRSLTIVKYTLVAAPALYLLIGLLAVSNARSTSVWIRGGAWAIPILAIVSCMMCLPDAYATDRPDWREFAQFVRNNSSDAEPVVFVGQNLQANGFRALGLIYNLNNSRSPLILLKDNPTPQFFSTLHGAREVCFVGDVDLGAVHLPPGAKAEQAALFPQLAIAQKVRLAADSTSTN